MVVDAAPGEALFVTAPMVASQEAASHAIQETNHVHRVGEPESADVHVDINNHQDSASDPVALYDQHGRLTGSQAKETDDNVPESTRTSRKDDDTQAGDTHDARQNAGSKDEKSGTDFSRPTKPDGDPVSDAELQHIRELEQTDREVHTHEWRHATVGGQYAGSPSYGYTTGPDGKRYATSGDVSVDVSPVPGDPEATIRKMRQVSAAALAPSDPSAADRHVAARAQQLMMQARMEMAQETSQGDDTNAQDAAFQTVPVAQSSDTQSTSV